MMEVDDQSMRIQRSVMNDEGFNEGDDIGYSGVAGIEKYGRGHQGRKVTRKMLDTDPKIDI